MINSIDKPLLLTYKKDHATTYATIKIINIKDTY